MASRNFIRLTSHKQFSGILRKLTPSNGYFSNLYKMLEKHRWNRFLLYLVVEILQLAHKVVVSPRCSIKKVFWKTSQNSQINTRSSHRRCSVKRKDVLKDFAKFVEKHLSRSHFFIKVAGWKVTWNLQKQLLEMFCKLRCS